MIPKIIHYCWLSNDPIPDSLQRCLDSWKLHLPDYKFILWNFNRFDISTSTWVRQAFESRKYAFAADYIRLYALFHYGGFYLDMDVEILKPLDSFLGLGTMICWQKDIGGLEVAAMGVEQGCEWIKVCMDYYKDRSFIVSSKEFDTKPLPQIVESQLVHNGYKLITVKNIRDAEAVRGYKEIPVFTSDYFSPKSYKSHRIELTENSVSIHHFAGSWVTEPPSVKMERELWNFLGLKNLNLINKIKWLPVNLLNKLHKSRPANE